MNLGAQPASIVYPTVEQLWSIANIVTGFSIAQNLAFLYALGKDLKELHTLPRRSRIIFTILVLIFTAGYAAAVACIGSIAKAHGDVDWPAWHQIDGGRITAIVFFGMLAALGPFAPEIIKRLSKEG